MKTIDRHYQIIQVKQIVTPEFKTASKGLDRVTAVYKHNGYIKHFTLISKPSNLGKGVCWFFICPVTGNTCRKMYNTELYGFVSRGVINAPYHQQTLSKLDRQYKYLREPDLLLDKLTAKNFKSVYAGQSTKRYLYLSKKLQQAREKEQKFLRVLVAGLR